MKRSSNESLFFQGAGGGIVGSVWPARVTVVLAGTRTLKSLRTAKKSNNPH